MQTLNQIIAQARDIMQSMPPASRLIAVLLVAAIIVSGFFLVRGTSSQTSEYLFAGRALSEAEIDAAEGAFSTAALNEYKIVGRRIEVPTLKRHEYMKALAENNAFPRQLSNGLEAALSQSSFLESSETTQRRFKAAKEESIANAIRSLSFIDEAFLAYDEQRNGFSTQKQQTASIWVRPRANVRLTDQQKRNIMRQVEESFAGLKYENISLIDMTEGTTLHGSSDPMSTEEQMYYQLRRKNEEEIRDKALNLLSAYGDVRVEVFVELDTTLREASETLKYNEKPTTIQTVETKKESSTAQPAEGGRPGASPNAIANKSASLTEMAETSKQKESSTQEVKITGQETTVTDRVGLKMTAAAISVSIPRSYYKTAFYRKWLDENPDKTSNDLSTIDKNVLVQGITSIKDEVDKKVQTSLLPLVPSVAAGADRFPSVTVTDYLDTPAEPIPEPSLAENLLVYMLGSWQWLASFGLVLVGLFMLRSFARSAPVGKVDAEFEKGFNIQLEDPASWDLSGLDVPLDDEEQEIVAGPNGEIRRFGSAGSNVKEELTAMVRDNPDAAASLLRTWIGEAA